MTEAGELPVNVWVWHLDISQQEAEQLSECLSDDEIQRADKFATAELRRRWIAGRAGMRDILASALCVPASRLTFAAGPHGRPWPGLPLLVQSQPQRESCRLCNLRCACGCGC